jgi:hypothetical protein
MSQIKCVCGLKRAARDHTDEICEKLRPFNMALIYKESTIAGNSFVENDYSDALYEYVENLLACAATSDSSYLREESLKHIFLHMANDSRPERLSPVLTGEQVPLLLIQLERTMTCIIGFDGICIEYHSQMSRRNLLNPVNSPSLRLKKDAATATFARTALTTSSIRR